MYGYRFPGLPLWRGASCRPPTKVQNWLPSRYLSAKPQSGTQEMFVKYLYEEFVRLCGGGLHRYSKWADRILEVRSKHSSSPNCPDGVKFG
jgi:hypothetical protein